MTQVHLPKGYSIGTCGEYQPRKSKLIVLYEGKNTLGQSPEGLEYWTMDFEHAAQCAWQNHYGRIADKINENLEDEANHVLAWRIIDTGDVYTADHLDHYVPSKNLEQITIATHSANYEIANMLCAHCGTGAVDDDILDEYHLLNEGWGYPDEDEE